MSENSEKAAIKKLRAELKSTAAQLEHWRALAHSRAGLEAQYGRMRQVLELIAAPKRKDGTYNRDRKACEVLAKAVLNRQDGVTASAVKIPEHTADAVNASDGSKVLHVCQTFKAKKSGNYFQGWFGLGDSCPHCNLIFTTEAMRSSKEGSK